MQDVMAAWSLLFMMKVMVWHFVGDAHKLMSALILDVFYLQSVVAVEFLCNLIGIVCHCLS